MEHTTHVIVIPYPAQGHVIPLMELAQQLVQNGVKVTFINTEVNHKLVTATWSEKGLMQMVSIPDGLEPWEDRSDLAKLAESIVQIMPGKLEELINKINKDDDNKATCVLADNCMGWSMHVAEKMGIRRATFWPASAATLASFLSFQKLIDDGVIDDCGVPLNDKMIHLSPSMPPIKPSNLTWACIGDLATTKIIFEVSTEAVKAATMAEWILCNSSDHLEPAAFTLFPQLSPIGPLLASNRLAEQAGHFWQEDSTCLTWLDTQAPGSVIYIAFGSFTIFDQTQFEELAIGLELTNRPFLWGWSGQVLAHPSVACFLSHCGWNSTLEGVNNGVPFVCWPYFADQFHNESYICDIWKNGLAFNKNKEGIITQGEIENKVNMLLSDGTFKEKAQTLKETVTSSIRKGGSSKENLTAFIEWIYEKEKVFSFVGLWGKSFGFYMNMATWEERFADIGLEKQTLSSLCHVSWKWFIWGPPFYICGPRNPLVYAHLARSIAGLYCSGFWKATKPDFFHYAANSMVNNTREATKSL
ncbi:UDP-glucuronosyl/UDP-glucosyltransferase [Artemisia annua]|uniref:UDP-glucuronosyl/UDP-glucosyltransferase n=1 Tax=Artemisia annua TaxID=35608 RepID=A0A2U1NIM7_ARTAN|nr:UDP-glucuronosyl/UDP-glucosyltransferase [Artemisia annua]